MSIRKTLNHIFVGWTFMSMNSNSIVGAICNREWVDLKIQFASANRSHSCAKQLEESIELL